MTQQFPQEISKYCNNSGTHGNIGPSLKVSAASGDGGAQGENFHVAHIAPDQTRSFIVNIAFL